MKKNTFETALYSIVGVIVLVLYPNKPALFMQGSAKMGGARA